MAATFKAEEVSPPRRDEWGDRVWRVCIEPSERVRDDGSRAISMGFPILYLSGWVGEPDEISALIAGLLTEHYAKSEPA